MDALAELGIVMVVFGIPVAFGVAYQRRHDGTTKAGLAVAGGALLGMVLSGLALARYHGWREQQRLHDAILHLTDPLCRSKGGDESLQALREMSCAKDAAVAHLEGPVAISIDKHGSLGGTVLPPAPPAGKTYVVWFVDARGTPRAHLALGYQQVAYLRDPGVADATGVVLTAETVVGVAPGAPVIASASFAAR